MRTRGDRDARGHRVPDRVRGLPVAAARRPPLPRRRQVRRPGELQRRCSSSSLWWDDFKTTVLFTVISVAIELVLGLALACVMHRALFGRRHRAAVDPHPVRDITVVAALAWSSRSRRARLHRTRGSTPIGRGSPSEDRRSSSSSSRRCGRPRPSWRCCCSPASRWCRTICSEAAKVDGADELAGVPQDHPAAHEGRRSSSRCCSAPWTRSAMFDTIFIQTQGAQRHRDACRSSATTRCSTA